MAPTKGNADMLANLTPEDRARNLALGSVARTNATLVREYIKNLAKAEFETNPESAKASLFYAFVGFPYDENDERITDPIRGSIARNLEAPDAGFLVEDEDETITLHRLVLDDDNNPVEIENEEGDSPKYETEEIVVPINDALREFALGFREDGKTRKGITIDWLLGLFPGVGSKKIADILENPKVRVKPGTQLRSLTQRQYYELLVVSGAEEADEDAEEIEEFDEDVEESEDVADEGDELDAAAEDFEDEADESEEEAEVEADSDEDEEPAEEIEEDEVEVEEEEVEE